MSLCDRPNSRDHCFHSSPGGLILAAREQVAQAVDSGLVTFYWHIGRRVHQDILKEKRAKYGPWLEK